MKTLIIWALAVAVLVAIAAQANAKNCTPEEKENGTCQTVRKQCNRRVACLEKRYARKCRGKKTENSRRCERILAKIKCIKYHQRDSRIQVKECVKFTLTKVPEKPVMAKANLLLSDYSENAMPSNEDYGEAAGSGEAEERKPTGEVFENPPPIRKGDGSATQEAINYARGITVEEVYYHDITLRLPGIGQVKFSGEHYDQVAYYRPRNMNGDTVTDRGLRVQFVERTTDCIKVQHQSWAGLTVCVRPDDFDFMANPSSYKYPFRWERVCLELYIVEKKAGVRFCYHYKIDHWYFNAYFDWDKSSVGRFVSDGGDDNDWISKYV